MNDKKYKKMWEEFIYLLAHLNTGTYLYPEDKAKITDLECVNKIVKELEKKYNE